MFSWNKNQLIYSKNRLRSIYPADIYVLKVNNRKTRKKCEYSKLSKLTITVIVNFKHNSHLFQVFLLFTLNK